MYGLYGWLLAKGQIAFLNDIPDTTADFICIYPEIYTDNFAKSPNVVRYLLNVPGAMHLKGTDYKPLEIGEKDLVYTFSQLYNVDPYKVDNDHIMFLPILNLHQFKVTNTGKRTIKIKFVGKGRDLHLPQTEGLFELDRGFANNQQLLAELLNECQVMYSYDNNSAMFEIARLCGCRVVIIPSRYSKEEFSQYEPGMNGISYGVDENTPLDAIEFRNHYKEMIKTFEERLDYFIEETQK